MVCGDFWVKMGLFLYDVVVGGCVEHNASDGQVKSDFGRQGITEYYKCQMLIWMQSEKRRN